MPDVNGDHLVDAADTSATAAAARKAKKKKARKSTSRNQVQNRRLQVATQLLSQTYGAHGDAAGGPGTARLEAALRVADELIELNAKMPVRKEPKDKVAKAGKESREPKGGARS